MSFWKTYAYGHNGQGKAPGGWVLRFDPDGSNREMINMGYRNPCDFALNRDGEMFVYDADMEWDMGAPGTAHPGKSRGIRRRKRLACNLQEMEKIFYRHRGIRGRYRPWLPNGSNRRY